MKFDVLSLANPSIVDVICANEMYPSDPSPFIVEEVILSVVFVSVIY
jgi:hypothetical protein